MLIKVQCFIYQWIRFDKLYKPMDSELLAEIRKIFERIARRE